MTTNELNLLATSLAHDVGIYPKGALFSEKHTIENTYIHTDIKQVSQLLLALQDKLKSVEAENRKVSDDQLTLW